MCACRPAADAGAVCDADAYGCGERVHPRTRNGRHGPLSGSLLQVSAFIYSLACTHLSSYLPDMQHALACAARENITCAQSRCPCPQIHLCRGLKKELIELLRGFVMSPLISAELGRLGNSMRRPGHLLTGAAVKTLQKRLQRCQVEACERRHGGSMKGFYRVDDACAGRRRGARKSVCGWRTSSRSSCGSTSGLWAYGAM